MLCSIRLGSGSIHEVGQLQLELSLKSFHPFSIKDTRRFEDSMRKEQCYEIRFVSAEISK